MNQLDQVNRHYFKEMKYTDWLSWVKFNKGYAPNEGFLVPSVIGIIVSVPPAILLTHYIFIITFICLIVFAIEYLLISNNEYKKLNKSYLVKLENDEKPKYYSKWYLEMNNYDDSYGKPIETKQDFHSKGSSYNNLYNSVMKNLTSNGYTILNVTEWVDGHWCYFKFYYYKSSEVKRESDRKHWKNTIPENRVLSWKEYKMWKKNKAKQQELLKQAEYIQEFKEYYGLEAQPLDKLLK